MLQSKWKIFHWIIFLSSFVIILSSQENNMAYTEQLNNEDNTSDATITSTEISHFSSAVYVSVNLHGNSSIICEGKVCVSKCCGPNSVLKQNSTRECINIASLNDTNLTPWRPELPPEIDTSKLVILHGDDEWPPKWVDNQKKNNKICKIFLKDYYLKPDGNLYDEKALESFSPENYCIDKNIETNDGETLIYLLCYDKVPDDSIFVAKVKYAGMLISCVCLVIIIGLNLLAKRRKNLETKCLISYCFSLLLSFIIHMTKMQSQTVLWKYSSCIALAIVQNFFFHSLNLWLNVLCFEMSRMIRNTFNAVSIRKMKRTNLCYVYYAIYSWGLAILTSALMLGMYYFPKDLPNIEPYIIRPQISLETCWFKDIEISLFIYQSGLEIILHLFNVMFLGHAAFLLKGNLVSLCCKKKSSNPSVSLQVNYTRNHVALFWQQFFIFNMFILIWIFDYIAFINAKAKFWRTFHVMVTLQGVFLLIIVSTSKRFALLKEAYETVSQLPKLFSSKFPVLSTSRSGTEQSSLSLDNEQTSVCNTGKSNLSLDNEQTSV